MREVAIVILHFIDKKLTTNCLESIKRLDVGGLRLEVIVVNNNPKEKLRYLKVKFSDFLFLETRENLGFAGGNNVGIKKALSDGANFILIINNDTILDEDLLVQLIKVGNGDEKIGILGPKIYFAPGFEFHKRRYKKSEQGKVIWYAGGLIDWQNLLASHRGVDEVDKGQYDKKIETDFVSGCAMFVKKEVFEKIGLLDKRYFLYWEDADFCQLAKEAGFKILYTPKAKLWHSNAGSSAVGSPLQDYYLTRNRLLFGLKFASPKTKVALIRESIKLLMTGRKWQKIGVRDFYLRKFKKGSYEA